MTPQDGKHDNSNSAADAFDDRDLLVGRPEGGGGRSAAGAAKSPAVANSPHPPAHDDTIAEILATVRATAARIDALQDEPGPGHETSEALARETAALIQAVKDARGALAKASELTARRDGAVEAAHALAGAAAALKTQGEALDQRIRATDSQSAVAGHSMQDMNQSAMSLNNQLRTLGNDLSRISDRLRWRYWRFGLAVAGAAFVFFVLGAVLQREADVMSFGDPRHEWNQHVVEHFAPLLAPCASLARMKDKPIECRLSIRPTREVTIPVYPEASLTPSPPDRNAGPEAEG